MPEQSEVDSIEPLFRLDLGANGGEFAPNGAEELWQWLHEESNFWAWTRSAPGHNHRTVIDNAVSQLEAARQAASQYKSGHAPAENLRHIQNHLRTAFLEMRLPHSSTALAKETEAIRQSSPEAAIAFLYGLMPHLANYRFDSNNPQSWHALIAGTFRAYGTPGNHELDAQRSALQQLHEAGEKLLGERRAEFSALEEDLAEAVHDAAKQAEDRAKAHAEFVLKSTDEHDALVQSATKNHEDLLRMHSEEMENIRKSYQAAMALRAPVDYWTKRQTYHRNRSRVLTGLVLVALLAAGYGIFEAAQWAISGSIDPAKPDAWRLVLVGVVAVLGVWLVRIIVRMFLSDLHLSTDAAERMTMVQTYLALVEGGKLTQDEDRKLVLQPLFRPAADGMVKDEGPPHFAMDYLTRAGRN